MCQAFGAALCQPLLRPPLRVWSYQLQRAQLNRAPSNTWSSPGKAEIGSHGPEWGRRPTRQHHAHCPGAQQDSQSWICAQARYVCASCTSSQELPLLLHGVLTRPAARTRDSLPLTDRLLAPSRQATHQRVPVPCLPVCRWMVCLEAVLCHRVPGE